MKQSLASESERQQKGHSHSAENNNMSPVSQAFVDNRASAAIQRQLMAKIANSPQAIAQRKLSELIHNSPQMLLQRQQMVQESSGIVQQVEDEEELLQGKFKTLQRVEEEELMQGKFNVAQRVEEEELLQGQFNTVQLAEEPVEKQNNTGLPDNLKHGIESLSGMSMDNVKVHYNSSKPAQLNALAYAQGTDIHLGAGQEKHLPHEAWHVVQQAQGRVKPTMQMKDGVPVNDDQSLEREADVMGDKALQMRRTDLIPETKTTAARAFVPTVQMVATRTKKVAPSAASIGELDADTWGYTEDERIKVEWNPQISGDSYHVKLNTIIGEYSIQSHLLAGVNEVTGPGGNTTSTNYQSQINGLNSLGDSGDPWYMLAAVDAHEHVHENSLGVALGKEKSNIEKLFSGIKAPKRLSKSAAKARMKSSQPFKKALKDGREKWDDQYLNRIDSDHTGRTPAAERRIVKPMVRKIQDAVKKNKW